MPTNLPYDLMIPCARAGCGTLTVLRCGACGGAAFCGEACSAEGWAAHAAACRALFETVRVWPCTPLAPVVLAVAPKPLRRVDIAFAAARDDMLAPPATLLSAVAPALLSFFDTRSVLPLRAACTEARAAVAAVPWEDMDEPIYRLDSWRACFPAACAAKISDRPAIGDAAFVHLRGIHTLDMGNCCNLSITDAAFVHLRGIHTLKMSGCFQRSITDAAFEHLRGIHTLDMSRCNQESITSAAFTHLRGIHTLNMSGCFQRSITDAAFEHLRGIHTLDMSYCDQQSITDAAFAHLRGIHTLNMSICRQPSITNAAFAHLRGVHTLDMSFCDQPSITSAVVVHLRGISVVRAVGLFF